MKVPQNEFETVTLRTSPFQAVSHVPGIDLSSRTNVRLVLNVVKELEFKILRLRLRTLRGFLAALEMTRELSEI